MNRTFERGRGLASAEWRARAPVFAALSFTVWLGFGSTYYLMTVLARPIADDTGWPLPFVIAGLSAGLVVAGLVSPLAGRAIERFGGRPVLATGSVLLAVGLSGLGLARSPVVYLAAWIVLGLGMAVGLYDAAFAALGRLHGLQAKGMIAGLTLTVGFGLAASWPLTAFLVGAMGWRGACFCYAALHAAIALPLHLLLLPAEGRRTTHASNDVPQRTAMASSGAQVSVTHRRPLLLGLLAANVTLSVCIGSVIQVHLLTLLRGLGLDLPTGVALGSLLWLAQGSGRLIEVFVGQYCHPVWEGVAASLLVLIGVAALLGENSIVIVVALVVFGIGNGVRIILKGTLPLILFGEGGYATLVGRLALPTLTAQAVAPALGALILTQWGTRPTMIALVILAGMNLILSAGLLVGAPGRKQAKTAFQAVSDPSI